MIFSPLNKQSGFTLIETISVLILLGIISAITVSKIGGLSTSIDVAAETEILKANLRYAQIRAMNSTYDNIWQITFSSNSYTLQQYNNNSSTWEDRNIPGETNATRIFKGTVSKSAGPGQIRFDSWGISVLGDGQTPESLDMVITLTDGTDSKSLTVTRNTGYIP